MGYTPVELRHVLLPKGLVRGYRREPVDRLLGDVADSFEAVWRERADLADRVEQLETDLQHHRQREALLSNTLIAAERAAADAREEAQRTAEQVVAEAHAEARSVMRGAIADREQLLGQTRRIRALLRSALEIVEEVEPSREAEDGSAWPAAHDTREFKSPHAAHVARSPEPSESAI